MTANFRTNYFKKLFLFCFCIGIVPVIALGYYSYAKSSSQFVEKANSRNADMVEQTKLRFEQRLKMIDNTQTQFVNSPLVQKAMRQQLDQHNYELYEELYQSLGKLQTYEFGLADVYLVSLDQNWLLTSRGREKYDESPQNSLFREYTDDSRGSFWTAVRSPLLYNDHNLLLVKLIKLNSLRASGLFVSVLPSAELSRMIPERSTLGEFYVLDGYNRVVAAANEQMVGVDISEYAFLARAYGSEEASGQYTVEADNGSNVITFLKSEYNGWTYVSRAGIKEITKESRAIGLMTLLLCLGLLALILVLSLHVTRRLYRPVSKLYGLALKSENISAAVHKKDEFYWIENLLQKLLGSHRQMSGQLREFFSLKLLHGAWSKAEIEERQHAQEMKEWRWLRVICVQVGSLDGLRYTEVDKDLLLFAINNMAGEVFPADLRLQPVVDNEFQVTLIASMAQHPDDTREETQRWAEQLRDAVGQYLKVPVGIGVSRLFVDLPQAPRAYAEAKEALSYGLRLGGETIVFVEDIYHEIAGQSLVFPQHIVNELVQSIRFADDEKTEHLLGEFLAFIMMKPISRQELRICLLRLLAELLRMYQEIGGAIQELDFAEEGLADELDGMKSLKEIKKWFTCAVIAPLRDQMDKKRESVQTGISEQMLKIIHEEFNTPLTLEELSSRLNYHPEYLRRVFRKATGVSFGDYVARHRLQIAKQYLLETNMTITRISEILLYNKPQNFIRYFRKMEGMTPGQYRDAYHRKG